MRKILALCLAVLMMAALAAPVMAADKTNVALGAEVELTGYLEASEAGKVVLTDGEYNTDMDYNAGNWGGKHAAFVIRYNADRETTEFESYKEPPYAEGFPYYSFITLKLENAADLSSYRLVMADPDFGVGEWTIQEWDILVSATGEPGSWKVVHEARATRENEEWKYDESEDLMWPVWTYEADLAEAKGVKYVALGLCLLCNHNDLGKGQYVNMLEIEVFGTAAGDAPATEDTTPVTEDTTPVTEDTTPVTEDTTPVTEDTTPVTEDTTDTETEAPATFDFVIVPAIALAAAAAGAVVLKKKEN
jgi:hypothetical protein